MLDCQVDERIRHFNEIVLTILQSTQSNKRDLSKYLNISNTTLSNYMKDGVPKHKEFLIMDRMEEYLFTHLGGK